VNRQFQTQTPKPNNSNSSIFKPVRRHCWLSFPSCDGYNVKVPAPSHRGDFSGYTDSARTSWLLRQHIFNEHMLRPSTTMCWYVFGPDLRKQCWVSAHWPRARWRRPNSTLDLGVGKTTPQASQLATFRFTKNWQWPRPLTYDESSVCLSECITVLSSPNCCRTVCHRLKICRRSSEKVLAESVYPRKVHAMRGRGDLELVSQAQDGKQGQKWRRTGLKILLVTAPKMYIWSSRNLNIKLGPSVKLRGWCNTASHEIEHGCGRHLEKSIWCHNSAVGGLI